MMSPTRAADDDTGPAMSGPGDARRRWPGSASTPDGPTGPRDYAMINAVFATGLAGIAALGARSEGKAGVPLRELPVIGLAAFALADVLAKQKVTTWLREPFVEESADHRPVGPEGNGVTYALGELVTCTRCVGSWCALGLVGLRMSAPGPGRGINAVLATAGANHFLQAGFAVLCETSSQATTQPTRPGA